MYCCGFYPLEVYTVSYQYDVANRLTKYTYDYTNKLTKVEKNSATLEEYVYDGDGKRIQLTKDSVTTTYVYSGLNVLYEENTTGTARYIYGSAGRFAKRTTISGETNTFYYHNDYLGSTRLVTDDNKNIAAAVTYHPFGESYSVEGSENYLFTGKEKDSTGLYYYGSRYYDPETDRFLTRDIQIGKIENPQSLNRFAYCYNNPVCYVDYDGRSPKKHYIDGHSAPSQEYGTLSPYSGEHFTVPTLIWTGVGMYLWLELLAIDPTKGAIVGGIFLICMTWNWFIDLVNEELFIDPMYEVQYECILPIYGSSPEKCTLIKHRDTYGRTFFVEIYDSQGNLVGAWITDQYGKIYIGWRISGGKYVIYNPETEKWEDAPEGWTPGEPLPGQSSSSNGDQESSDS